MTATEPSATAVQSRDNPWVRRLRRLAEQPLAYRKLGQYWIEGEHLCDAVLQRGWTPQAAVFSESAWSRLPSRFRQACAHNVVLKDPLFAGLSGLPSPAGFGFLLACPDDQRPMARVSTVVLDRVQDAGNVGSILRSAAAFGVAQVLALSGTAGLWSPKVLRAGMGAHFALHLVESAGPEALADLKVPLIATSSHAGEFLHQCRLPSPCAWVFGHEGQGVDQRWIDAAALKVRIAQPGGEESLNVAAAAAICLHASAAQGPDGAGFETRGTAARSL
jgi:RNA methyltransferase, TrmH family